PPNDDFRLTPDGGGPEWHLSSVGYEVFIDRFAPSGAVHELPEWAIARAWDDQPESARGLTNREVFGGDLPGLEARLDHVAELGANTLYLTPFFPAESTHRYDPSAYDRVDPL